MPNPIIRLKKCVKQLLVRNHQEEHWESRTAGVSVEGKLLLNYSLEVSNDTAAVGEIAR